MGLIIAVSLVTVLLPKGSPTFNRRSGKRPSTPLKQIDAMTKMFQMPFAILKYAINVRQ